MSEIIMSAFIVLLYEGQSLQLFHCFSCIIMQQVWCWTELNGKQWPQCVKSHQNKQTNKQIKCTIKSMICSKVVSRFQDCSKVTWWNGEKRKISSATKCVFLCLFFWKRLKCYPLFQTENHCLVKLFTTHRYAPGCKQTLSQFTHWFWICCVMT